MYQIQKEVEKLGLFNIHMLNHVSCNGWVKMDKFL